MSRQNRELPTVSRKTAGPLPQRMLRPSLLRATQAIRGQETYLITQVESDDAENAARAALKVTVPPQRVHPPAATSTRPESLLFVHGAGWGPARDRAGAGGAAPGALLQHQCWQDRPRQTGEHHPAQGATIRPPPFAPACLSPLSLPFLPQICPDLHVDSSYETVKELQRFGAPIFHLITIFSMPRPGG